MNNTEFMKLMVFVFILINVILGAAQAATIKKVKGTKVLISIDGSELRINDQFFSVNSVGKKRSLLRVTNLKGNQAIAEVVKGLPEVGHVLQATAAAPQKSVTRETAPASDMSHMGVLGSYLMNKMSVKYTVDGTDYTVAMAGTGFGLLGYYDFDYSSAIQFRAAGGYEQFQVTESCSALTTCDAKISYLSGYGIAKYNFITGATKVWVGGGLGLLWALSKSSTVLDSAQITSNYITTLSVGLDFDMGQGQYLPLVFDYSMFPSSSTVTANFMVLRVGWGWR